MQRVFMLNGIILHVIMLNALMQKVFMLSVNVILLNVVAWSNITKRFLECVCFCSKIGSQSLASFVSLVLYLCGVQELTRGPC